MAETLLALIMFVALCWVIYALFALVGDMARVRGHNPWPWWLLSLAWSPLACIVIMWLFFSVKDEPAELRDDQ